MVFILTSYFTIIFSNVQLYQEVKRQRQVILNMYQIRRLKETRHILILSVLQAISPVVFMIPLFAVKVGMAVWGEQPVAESFASAVFLLNSVFDALVTLTVVTDYKKSLIRFYQILCLKI